MAAREKTIKKQLSRNIYFLVATVMRITTPKQESSTQNWENIKKESRHIQQCTFDKQILIHNTCNTLRK